MRIAISADSKQGLDSVVGPPLGAAPTLSWWTWRAARCVGSATWTTPTTRDTSLDRYLPSLPAWGPMSCSPEAWRPGNHVLSAVRYRRRHRRLRHRSPVGGALPGRPVEGRCPVPRECRARARRFPPRGNTRRMSWAACERKRSRSAGSSTRSRDAWAARRRQAIKHAGHLLRRQTDGTSMALWQNHATLDLREREFRRNRV